MSLNYSLGEEIDDAVSELIGRVGRTNSPDLIRELATTALKLVEDGASRGDLKILNSAIKELRYAFRLFAPFNEYRKVSIFGSARVPTESPEYAQAQELAAAVVRAGMLVITGAGPGIMEAGNRGAGDGGSFGLAIRLSMEPEANPYIRRPDRLINFKYFFTRKLCFIKESDAVVLFPGGFGTMDECFELLTLLQTGKCDPRPVVLMDPPGSTYWTDWLDVLRRQLADRGLIDPRDLGLLTHASETDRALKEIQGFYANYHSSRYVGDKLLLRLEVPPSDSDLDEWTEEFREILIDGAIARMPLPPEDLEDPVLRQFHGIAFRFDRKSFAGLRSLINRVNRFEGGATWTPRVSGK